MNVTIPTGWKRVEEPDFIEFLKTCPDYTRDAYVNCIRYTFRGYDRTFAVVTGKGDSHILVDPALVEL